MGLKASGVDMTLFTPHSTRAAPSSAAQRDIVPLATIVKTAGWSKKSTFARYYNNPIRDIDLESAVGFSG